MSAFIVKAYCAGITIFEKSVPVDELEEFLATSKEEWKKGEFKISFASGQVQTATEMCLDVYEQGTSKYRFELSKAFKP
jgi:hypothetical protein